MHGLSTHLSPPRRSPCPGRRAPSERGHSGQVPALVDGHVRGRAAQVVFLCHGDHVSEEPALLLPEAHLEPAAERRHQVPGAAGGGVSHGVSFLSGRCQGPAPSPAPSPGPLLAAGLGLLQPLSLPARRGSSWLVWRVWKESVRTEVGRVGCWRLPGTWAQRCLIHAERAGLGGCAVGSPLGPGAALQWRGP